MALSDEDKRKIAQILHEEKPDKSSQKPPFPYGRHLWWTFVTGGLWLPVWIYKSFMHDRDWQKSREAGTGIKDPKT